MSIPQSTRRVRFAFLKWAHLHGFLFLKRKRTKPLFWNGNCVKIPILLCVLTFCTLLWYSWSSAAYLGNSFEVDEAQLSINPVDETLFLYSPLSNTRPKYQFRNREEKGRNSAVYDSRHINANLFSVFTFSQRPSVKLLDTAHSILNQSLQDLQWIVFHSCDVQEDCSNILQRVEQLDKRISIVETSAQMDFEGRFKSVISFLKARPTRFFTFLQEGDMFELTTLEKGAWLFSSNSDVDFATTFVRETSKESFVWRNGFHNGLNPFDSGEEEVSFWIMGKSNVLLRNKCIQLSGDIFSSNGTLRKCLQQSSICGVTIPEVLRWSHHKPLEFTAANRESSITEQPPSFNELRNLNHNKKQKMACSLDKVSDRDEIRFNIPWENQLHMKKGVMFILPWMDIGGADIANLNLLQEFSKRGYRVTVVCTLMQVHGASRVLESLFLRFSHDIFTIPNIIRVVDAPRFLSYLIMSRKVELIFLSNSELGYSLLPYLSQTHRSVRIVDYVHNEQPDWRQGGYPFMSAKAKKHLDLTFSSSKSAIKFMRTHGKDKNGVRLGHLGIKLGHLKPFDDGKKSVIRQRLGIPSNAILISFVGRTVRVKQPMALLKAFIRIAKNFTSEDYEMNEIGPIHLLIAGDGEEKNELELESKHHSHIITLQPRVVHKEAVELIGASDIFCLPSLSEGISFATAEAMALGVAVITSNIGGFPEIIGKNNEAGLMFQPSGNEEDNILELMLLLEKLLRNSGWRKALQKRGERRVRHIFDASVTIPALVTEIITTKIVRKTTRTPRMKMQLKRELFHYRKVNGPMTDFTHIQRALLVKERDGYGAKYQRACGEYGERMTSLIDALERGSSCEGYTLDVQTLRRSALSQCGRTKIANLEDRNNIMGWELLEKCNGFVPVVL